ncbi:MAG: sigma-70 family RNA polymerase sigma factor, partial [Actinobacteria bacterium]|nr:sigma-70 family RNA polymerase sigma factor [Actinomycetota bacterium]
DRRLMDDDSALLKQFISTRDEQAFEALVRRYVDLVYSAARRQVRDDAAAQDVTQQVFVLLAEKANTVRDSQAIAGWLLVTTRYVALNAVRSEGRRRRHEREAAVMHEKRRTKNEPAWEQVGPMLDEAVARLKTEDRDALALRYFQGRSVADVAATMGISQEAAQKLADEAASASASRVPPAGWDVPGRADDANAELEALVRMLAMLRDLVPPELRAQLAELVRHLLLFVRAVLDWWIERMAERPRGDEPPVGRTAKPVTGFRGRSGRTFRAKLRIEQSDDGKWRVEFDEDWAKEPPKGEADGESGDARRSQHRAQIEADRAQCRHNDDERERVEQNALDQTAQCPNARRASQVPRRLLARRDDRRRPVHQTGDQPARHEIQQDKQQKLDAAPQERDAALAGVDVLGEERAHLDLADVHESHRTTGVVGGGTPRLSVRRVPCGGHEARDVPPSRSHRSTTSR